MHITKLSFSMWRLTGCTRDDKSVFDCGKDLRLKMRLFNLAEMNSINVGKKRFVGKV